jgi:integrase
VLELVRVAFAWAVDREEVPATPCVGLKKSAEPKRERALSHGELRRILLALDVEETGEPSADLAKLVRKANAKPGLKDANGKDGEEESPAPAPHSVKNEEQESHALAPHPLEACAWRLLFLTGLRIREVLGGRWAEVDAKARRWTLPADRMKGGRAHVVPLSKAALDALSRLRDLAGSSPWIVQSPRDPKKSLATLQHSLARLQDLSATSGWSAHDLRHTLRSELSAQGVGFEVKELILAHVLPSLAGVYDHHSYLPERAAALEAWARTLARLRTGEPTQGAEVIPFPAEKR